MDSHTISEGLLERIAKRKVIAAAFTSYTFEPEFFELEIIQDLLDQKNVYSSDDRIKTMQVRDTLRESALLIEVFYDRTVFLQSAQESPKMEYRVHGVNSGNNAFHAKNIFLLVEDENLSTQSLLVAAGSNNISKSGYWDNIETQHWIEVSQNEIDLTLLDELKEDVKWLINHRSTQTESALDKILIFLEGCHGRNKKLKEYYYYGLSDNRSFFDLLKETLVKVRSRRRSQWHLEIISPFFADNTKNLLHDEFKDFMKIKSIRMLLPFDQEGLALCEKEYFEHIQRCDGIEWGKWCTKTSNTLGVSDELFRKLHAKVYHFYNDEEAWVFVGSVNFSHKATYANVESGFLVKLDTVEPLLEVYPDQSNKFNPPGENEPGGDLTQEALEYPEIHLSFNWLNKELTGRSASDYQYEVSIINTEGDTIIESWTLTSDEAVYTGEIDSLKSLLKHGSLIMIRGTNSKTNEAFAEHRILLQQTNWTHKPLHDIGSLNTEEILAIYAGMSEEKRKLQLIQALQTYLYQNNMQGELSGEFEYSESAQFFCQYAEIFHAFRKLKARLLDAAAEKDIGKVDYYLTGTGLESLPSLIKQTNNAEVIQDEITSYLLLLSAKELYQQKEFINYTNVHTEIKILEAAISEIKYKNRIKLSRGTDKEIGQFYEWFEEQFFRAYEVVESETTEVAK